MQLAAFLCVICAICGRITRKSTLSIAKEETPMSLADYADLRRQKTVRSNVSAKADAADNAEKDSYHIVECCLLFIQQICKRTRLLLFAHSLPFPYFFLVLSLLVLCSFLMFPCSFLMCLTAVLAFLAEIKCRN